MQASVVEVMSKLLAGFKEIDKPTVYISHLTQKAQALVRGEDISLTAVQYQQNKSATKGPITDIGVTFNKKRIPQGWELIEKSMSGKLSANVNKGNGKEVFLCIKRQEKTSSNSNGAGSKQRPLTGLGIIFKNLSEEPSLGFRAIEKTVTGEQANLNVNNTQGHAVYLCTHRGQGAPIQDICVIFPDKKETLPVGYHVVKHTPFGKQADMNSQTNGQSVYLCFRPDCQPVLDRFEVFHKSSDSEVRLAALCLSVLIECFYSYDTRVVCFALEAFRRVPFSWAAEPINLFVTSLCDASICFNAYFTSELHTFFLKSQEQIFMNFLHSLHVPTVLRIFETCLLIRHEDKKLDAFSHMIDFLVESSFRSVPCKCRNKQHKKWSPAVGPLCSVCVNKQKDSEFLTSTSFCNNIVQNLINNVRISGRIEIDVSQFSRIRSRSFADVESENDRFHFTEWAQLLLNYESMTKAEKITMPQLASLMSLEEEEKEKDLDIVVIQTQPPLTSSLSLTDNSNNTSLTSTTSTANTVTSEEKEEDDERDIVIEESPDGGTSTSGFAPLRASLMADAQEETKKAVVTLEQKQALQPKIELALFSTTILLCKYMSESLPFKLEKSERVKRKAHALDLLTHLLEKGRYFFHSCLGSSSYLIRRFVCSSLLVAGVTDVSFVFQNVLKAFLVLCQHYQDMLITELGVFVDHIFLKLLDHPYTTLDQKKMIVDVFLLVFEKPQAVINLYYNYDNRRKSWPIFEHLVTGIAKIVEGDFQAQQATRAQAQQKLKATSESQAKIDELTRNALEKEDSALEILQKNCLKFLIQILQCEAQWLGVPDVPGTREGGGAGGGAEKETETALGFEEVKDSTEVAKLRRERAGTWIVRWDSSKNAAKINDKAINIAREKSIKDAMKYLRVTIPTREVSRLAVMQEIAKFLLHNENLDKRQVGDCISELSDKNFTEYEYIDLRREFVKLLDFSNLTFDDALRTFLKDSNFRLPGEGQKIERLLDMFGEGYCRDNPDRFTAETARDVSPASQAAFLAFAVMLLHTDAWNPSVTNKMSKPTFIDLCSGKEAGKAKYFFGEDFLSNMYTSITTHEFTDLSGTKEAKEHVVIELTEEQQLETWREDFYLLVRKANATLRQTACESFRLFTTTSAELIRPIFDVSWYKIVAAIIAQTQPRTDIPSDIDTLHMCLDGLGYGACIAILLGLETENKAFAMHLAKITFVERCKREGMSQVLLNRKLMNAEHLKQEWYKPHNLMSEKQPGKACKSVIKEVKTNKAAVSDERRQAILRRIQAEFDNTITLAGNRSFVKEGMLTKAGDQGVGKKHDYMFMLFSDLLLYASEGMQAKYKARRVMHLSLCRLVDVQDDRFKHSFKVVSPQKSILILCPSEKAKAEWIETIHKCLIQVMEARRAYIAGLDKEPQSEDSSAAPVLDPSARTAEDDEEVMRRCSTFIGRTFSDRALEGEKEASICKLCIKRFGVMRRRLVCKYCREAVCGDCCKQKWVLPGKGKPGSPERVCDACFGALAGMVGEGVPLLSKTRDALISVMASKR